jgi:hypothetical protein
VPNAMDEMSVSKGSFENDMNKNKNINGVRSLGRTVRWSKREKAISVK